MKPGAGASGNIDQVFKWVESAGVDLTSLRNDDLRPCALGDLSREMIRLHSPITVRVDANDPVVTQTKKLQRGEN